MASNGNSGSGSGSKPTVLWIHGSWHTPAHFGPAIERAQAKGFANECPRQPSVGNKPPLGLMDDAACIRDTLQRLVEQEGREVLVVAHSYGGMVANEGIGSRFSRQERAARGEKGGVLRIIFLTAFALPEGSGLVAPFGGSIPPFIPVDEDEMCHMENPGQVFYHDLSPAEQEKWIAELRKSPASTQTTPLTQTVYAAHPCTYLHCTEDQGIPYAVQQSMVKAASDKYGIVFATDTLHSSHSPFLSMPDNMLAAIERQLEATGTAY